MQKMILAILTVMMAGRMMTVAFIARAGGTAPGDPPAAWLMPLIGDAIIGATALIVTWLIWTKRGSAIWATIIAWHAMGTWDALSAYIISRTNPWPDFFMLQIFGSSMFFMATAMHVVAIYLALTPAIWDHFLQPDPKPD